MIIFWLNYTASYVEAHDYLAPGIVSLSAEQAAAATAAAARRTRGRQLYRLLGGQK